MSMESLKQRLRDRGITDFSPEGLLQQALKDGDQYTIEQVEKLVELTKKNNDESIKLILMK
jgi:hypothetical protein